MKATVAAMLLWCAPCLAADAENRPMYLEGEGVTSLWALDIGVVGAGAAGWFALGGVPALNPGRVANPGGLDAAQPKWNSGALVPSDFLAHPFHFHSEVGYLNLPVLTLIGTSVAGGLAAKSAEAGVVDGILIAESVAITSVASSALKIIASRPRPFTNPEFREQFPDEWDDPELQAYFTEEEDFEAYKSWPSGHAASAGATYFSAAMLIGLHANNGRLGGPVFYIANTVALALTVTTGVLRVQYGVHHPTDVIWGGLLGAGIGVGVPLLHLKR